MEILYENLEELFGMFNSDFQNIFDSMRDYGVYNKIGLSFIVITSVLFLGFYFFYKNPYAKLFPHWILTLLVSGLLSAFAAYFIVRTGLAEHLLNGDSETVNFTESLVLSYTFMNLVLALIFGFLISQALRLGSKIQPHLPF